MADEAAQAATEKMRAAGQSEDAIKNFISALQRVQRGEDTMMPSAALEPAPDEPSLDDLPDVDPAEAFAEVAVIKLNGGLATSMGLRQPKSLLPAREGLTFLEIIVGQTLALRRRHGVRLPLILMNSEATREPTLEALRATPEIASPGLELDFLQSMVPKLEASTLLPASCPAAPELEWNPPGHGDVYSSLRGAGTLKALLDQGFRYAMISNSDNLGSTVEPRIAAHMAAEQIPFLMETVLGTKADRKGGHIAKRVSDGQLVLREIAQTPQEDTDSFRDFRRWRFYNTNSLWVDLKVLENHLASGEGLELPVIVNKKTIDPRDLDSTPVVQLESAMGAAIGSFPGARLLLVPRTRFVPVKTTDDLLVLRSDAYKLGDDFHVQPVGDELPYVDLDEHYRLIDDFEQRIPEPPSLCEAERLVVRGDITFDPGVVVRGSVELNAEEPITLEAGTVLEG